ncbi:zinc-dependent metalloprotease [Telluribacter sp. SYSU D00476]|uniref:zinc-dependent metalloprotease n=1 Tax=Telluribacter sp. SYSU D00476 TaxID=2811430 RepID=UPI001FF3E98A|nr:zinc-dependent metalloprotease [Telluribacter sp. SYSU D00476]
MRLLLLSLLLMHLLAGPVSGQTEGNYDPAEVCKAPLLPAQVRLAYQQAYEQYSSRQGATARQQATTVAVKVHNVLTMQGVGDVAAYLNQVFAVLNTKFAPMGISFFQLGEVHYIQNDNFYDLAMSEDKELTSAHSVQNAVNLYFVGNADGSNGYAYPPNLDSARNTRSWNALFVSTSRNIPQSQIINEVIPHEMGHYFGLLHTHEHGSASNLDPATREYVTRGTGANCAYAGDQICDTPADPYLLLITSDRQLAQSSCSSGFMSTLDPRREVYRPDVTNLMSYYRGCRTSLTPQQYDRMKWGLSLRNQVNPDPADRYYIDGQVRLLHQPIATSYCAGAAMEVAYWQYGELQNGSQLRLRLTQSDGSSPVELPATSIEGTRLSGTLPPNLPSGTYRVQVIATNSAVASAATDLLVVGKPTISVQQTGGKLILQSSSAGTNQWYLNGVAIKDSVRQQLYPTEAGTYTVQTTEAGCTMASDPFVITAPEPTDKLSVLLYPNPNRGSFWVELPSHPGPWQAEVFTLSGQPVLQASSSPDAPDRHPIGIRAPSGVYLLRITAGGKSTQVKFVVE